MLGLANYIRSLASNETRAMRSSGLSRSGRNWWQYRGTAPCRPCLRLRKFAYRRLTRRRVDRGFDDFEAALRGLSVNVFLFERVENIQAFHDPAESGVLAIEVRRGAEHEEEGRGG